MKWGTANLRQLSVLGPQYGANAGAIEWSGKRPRYIRITDIRADGQLLVDGAVEADLADENEFKLEDGDLLFARSGNTVGKTYRYNKIDGPSVFAGYLIRFRLNRDLVDSRYVFFYTQSADYKQWLLRKRRVGGQPNVNGAEYASLVLPLAPVSEQKRIVELLEQANSLRRQRIEADGLADRILPALFRRMFGDPLTNTKNWGVKTIGELCEVSRGASPRPITDYMGGSVPWIKIGDGSSSGPYLSSTAEFVTEEGAEKSFFVPPGSLIVANSGVSCGFARILKISGCIHDGWLALLNICKDVEPLYLLAFINLMTLELRRRAPGGTQPNLNTALMKSVKLPLPPLTLQESFSKKFAELFTLRTQQQDAANSIESLFATMLHRAFTGELTAKWREAHLKELLVEMEHQAKLLRTAAQTN